MSFYTSLTGLKAASTELSVTSNNIANSGTTSFKRSSPQFGDIFSTSTLQRSSSGIGSGVALLSVSQQFTQGNIESSENALDLAITGDGFFPLKSPDGAELFTRNGAFKLDDQNFVVNNEGQALQVHPLDGNGESNFDAFTIGLQVQQDVAAEPTTEISQNLRFPLDGDVVPGPIDPSNTLTFSAAQTFSLFDDDGSSYTATVYYRKSGDDVDDGAGNIEDTFEAQMFVGEDLIPSDTINFNFNSATGALNTAPAPTMTIPASVADSRTGDVTLSLTAVGHTKDFEVISQSANGRTPGGLVNIDIGNDGLVTATYSNGQQLRTGIINLASFSSSEGLRQDGATNYSTTLASGIAEYARPGSTGIGTIRSGALERSNVDITEELIDLISAQRNFQANAKAIETSSTLTSTIINMRG